ncbi:MAG: ADP-ribosylglycohydrolase family protein [Streptosporangiales bacterium]|nr:ADP-ribosylglycohydrolase family protein [Streptosporangiales bacterium]
MRLTWVQPEDLLPHELAQSRVEGKDVDDVAARWVAAGGSVDVVAGGASAADGTGDLRAPARTLLDELDALPASAEHRRDEPDDLAAIEALWSGAPALPEPDLDALRGRLRGAWLGRAAGCLLGKPVEKIPREGIREILRSTGRWPLAGYFTAVGLPAAVAERWPWNRRSRTTSLAENIDGMPEDDDLNYAMLALQVVEEHGSSFTTEDVAQAWLDGLPAGRVFTAERIAYRNLLDGLVPPRTAVVRNPFRHWIGAQIRTDVYGWVCPGRPHEAARLAWRDARLSHTGSGTYGAMFVAAASAAAVVTDDVGAVLAHGLAVVPPDSALAVAVRRGMALAAAGTGVEDALDTLHTEFGHLHWVHAVNNAALVAYALAASDGDFVPAVCAAVTGGWDTDSDGATVGALAGAMRGVPESWTRPLHDRVASSLPGFDGVALTSLADRTFALAEGGRASC